MAEVTVLEGDPIPSLLKRAQPDWISLDTVGWSFGSCEVPFRGSNARLVKLQLKSDGRVPTVTSYRRVTPSHRQDKTGGQAYHTLV